MKVLVIGSGGREHALAWKFAQSPGVERVYVAPGNGGTAREEKCVNVAVPGGDPSAIAAQEALAVFAKAEGVDLTVIGPEAPLAAGIVDRFRSKGLAVVGPDARSSQLEASKAFSKAFMEKYMVRAARSLSTSSIDEALAHNCAHFAKGGATPLVVKADGLAAGKGVVVAATVEEAEEAIRSFMGELTLGDAGKTLVLEEFLPGVEVSVLAAVSVRGGLSAAGGAGAGSASGAILPFVSARDHKRRFEGARGPNTGGMGAIAPVPDFTEAAEADFRAAILEPTLRGIAAENFDYRGFIFFGLMVENGRCSLLEYNVRLGDPETEAVLPLMDSDLVLLCASILDGSLASFPLEWKTAHCCAPFAVADGYPGNYRKGDAISVDQAALERADASVFFAGAALDGDELRTSGGRVLAVSAVAADAGEARRKAYAGMEAIRFAGMGYRRDIGTEKAGG